MPTSIKITQIICEKCVKGVFRRNIEVREALSEFVETQEEEKRRENRRFEEQEKMLQVLTFLLVDIEASKWFGSN